jgi:hypothetical protein
LDAVDANLKAGRTQVYDADLKEYCDARPHGKEGLCHMVNARLIRYANDFVVMAGNVSDYVQNWVVTKIESRMGEIYMSDWKRGKET